MSWILLALVVLISAALAGDIVARLSGQHGEKTATLTTNVTSLVHLNWDGMRAGGQYDIRAFLEDERVVLVEQTMSANDGIANNTTSKTVIPTNKLPRRITMGQTTVTVSRVEQDKKK